MSLYCVKQMSALHWVGGISKICSWRLSLWISQASRWMGGGLRPNAYDEYVTPFNKMILRERQFLHYYVYPSLLLNLEMERK